MTERPLPWGVVSMPGHLRLDPVLGPMAARAEKNYPNATLCEVVDANRKTVVVCMDLEVALHICRCVNAHERLTATVKAAVPSMQLAAELLSAIGPVPTRDGAPTIGQTIAQLKAGARIAQTFLEDV